MSDELLDTRPGKRLTRWLLPGSDSLAWWAAGALLVNLLLLLGMLVFGLGIARAATLIGCVLGLATVPGGALVRLLFPGARPLYYLVLGTVIGLGLWAIGGLLSSVSGIYLIRWLPTALALALWFWPKRRLQRPLQPSGTGFPVWGAVGSVLASMALLPALKVALVTQPVEWQGWHQFYVDLPFQIALTSEVAARVPESYPWVPDAVLSYTWLYHSAMGLWSSVTAVPAAEIVLRAWPILVVAIMPLLLSIVAWEVTHRRLVAAAAPVVYVLVHGLVVVSGSALEQQPLLQISPTRDFAHLFTLLAVLSMVRLFQRNDAPVPGRRWWLVLLVFSSFVAVGAKGSELPIIVGGILSAGLALILTRRVKLTDFVALAWLFAAVIGSTLLVLPEPGVAALSWGPLTFLPPDRPGGALTSIMVLALLAVGVVSFLIVIGRDERAGWPAAAVLAGVSAAGIAGLGLFTHPGGSQLYFWQGAQPVFAIAMTWALVVLWGRYRLSLVVATTLVFFVAHLTWTITNHLLVVAVVTAVVAGCAAVVLHRLLENGNRAVAWRQRWGATAVLAAVLMSTAQIVSFPTGRSGGATSDSSSQRAIHGTQLEAFQYIRAHSAPEEMVVTNKHCFAGSVLTDDCVPRWFAVAAWSERSVLVEGWAYTHLDTSPESVREQLELSGEFINSPTVNELQGLLERGVTLVYVDKREPYSRDLAKVATLVYESEWANVYSLTGDRPA